MPVDVTVAVLPPWVFVDVVILVDVGTGPVVARVTIEVLVLVPLVAVEVTSSC